MQLQMYLITSLKRTHMPHKSEKENKLGCYNRMKKPSFPSFCCLMFLAYGDALETA